MEAPCRAEVLELHRSRAAWLGGDVPPREGLERVGSAVADDVEIIDPGSTRRSRAALLAELAEACDRAATRPSRIWIERIASWPLAAELRLVTYEQEQDTGGGPRGLLSSALFGWRAAAPNRVVWHHPHEVWRPPGPDR